MRHYESEEPSTRGAIVAQATKPLIDTVRDYNPHVDALKKFTIDDLMRNPALLGGEFVLQGPKSTEIRIRPVGYTTELSLTGRPGSSRDHWVYFIDLGDSKILVGVNTLDPDNSSADRVIDDVVRATRITELDSIPQDVSRYMRKRIA